MEDPEPSLVTVIRRLDKRVWLLSGGIFINQAGGFTWYFLPLFLRSSGFSTAVSAVCLLSFGAGGLLAALAGGWSADRLGPRRTMILSSVTTGVLLLLLTGAILHGSAWPAMSLCFVAGISYNAYRPAGVTLLADLVPVAHQRIGFAVWRMALNLGMTLGGLVAGEAAQVSISYVFIVDAVTSVAFGLLITFFLRPAPPRGQPRTATLGLSEAMKKDKPFLLILAASALTSMVYFQQSSLLPLRISLLHLPPRVFGFLLSLNGALIIVCEIPVTRYTRRIPARAVTAAGAVLVGGGFALTGAAHSRIALAGTVVAWSLGEILIGPAATAWVADIAPGGLAARYQGMSGLMWALGRMLGPAGGLAIYTASSPTVWELCFALGIVSAMIFCRAGASRYGSAKTLRRRG